MNPMSHEDKLSKAEPTTVGDLKRILNRALDHLSKLDSSLPILNVLIDQNKGEGVLYENIRDFNLHIEPVDTPTGVEFDVCVEFVGDNEEMTL